MTQATGRSKGDNLQQALQMMGMGQAQAALKAASYDLSRGDMAGYHKNMVEAFTGIDPGRIGRHMMPSHAMCSPSHAMGASVQRFDLKHMTGSKGGALLGALGGFAVGGPLGALAGGLLGRGIGRRMKAKCLEKRLNRNPVFRAQFEAMTGGKYIPDGRNDGKITLARPNFGLPGFNPGILPGMSGNIVAGSALSGLSRMMQNATMLMGGMGMTGMGAFGASAGQLAGAFSGGLGYGSLNTGAGLRGKLGLDRTSGGPGSRVAKLPPNATFEDLVAAFMMDTLKDMQDEAKQIMDRLKRSNQSRNRRGYGGMLGGLGQIGGGLVGGMFGGPIGAQLGSGLGGALGRGIGGQGKQGEDSRQLMFEELKNMMQKIQQMFQSLSNVLNTMHQGAMNSIRNIRA
jgi:hypothetical protein